MPQGGSAQGPGGPEDELSQLRAELQRLRSVVFELVRVLRAHIANVAIFNQAHVSAQMIDRLEELSRSEDKDD